MSWTKTSKQGKRAPAAKRKARTAQNWKQRRLHLEPLEDRTLLSVYSDLYNTVGQLASLETSIENTLNKLEHVPFLDQTKLGTILHGVQQPLLISNTLITALQDVLNPQNNNWDPNDPTTDMKIEQAISTQFQQLNKKLNPPLSEVLQDIVSMSDGKQIEIDMHVHQDLAQVTLPISLSFGLNGLPIAVGATVTGGVNLSVTFDCELAFGFSEQGGFFLKGKQLNNSQDALVVEAKASFNDTPNPTSLLATVGVLKGALQDYVQVPNETDDPSTLDAAFHVAPFSYSNGQFQVPTPTLTGTAHISLFAAVGFDSFDGGKSNKDIPNSWLPANTPVKLPQLTSHFLLQWDLTTSDTSPDPSKLSVQFEDVKLDLGTMLQSFTAPIVSIVQDIFGPIQPVLNFLTTPIPGISDLSHLVGQGDVTLYSIAERVAAAVIGPEVKPILDFVGNLLPVINDIDQIKGGRWISLGDFDLNSGGQGGDLDQLVNGSVNWSGLTDTGNLAKLTNLLVDSPQVKDLLGQLGGGPLDNAIKSGLNDLKTLSGTLLGQDPAKFHFDFPVLNDPVNSVFLLLLGQDADLFDFDAHLDIQPPKNANISPNPFDYYGVSINFLDNMSIDGEFRLAYDTYGMREFFSNQGKKPSDLLDGFYIDADKTKLTFQGSIGPAVAFNPFPGVSVQLTGQFETGNNGFTISLDGPGGGKARLTSLFGQNCLFDGLGELDASLGIDFKLGFDTPLGFVGVEHDFPIATVTIVNYPTQTCLGAPQPPAVDLATKDQNRRLNLNLAGVAKYLQDHGQSAETFEIKDEGGTAHHENLAVTALGKTDHFTDIDSIFSDGSMPLVAFDENITIDNGVLDDAMLTGGPQVNKLTYLGTGKATLIAGPGAAENSQLTGGSGMNMLTGGAGTDVLIGGPSSGGANNTLAAGDGTEQLYAGPTSNDTLQGGAGTDSFYAGGGQDTMTGGSGKNTFNWKEGDGPLQVTGGSGGDNTLIVLGSQQGDQFLVDQDKNGDGGFLIQAPGNSIQAFLIQALNLDGLAGGSSYTVDDLSLTPIQYVGLNLHEATNTDQSADQIKVNSPPTKDTVTIYWDRDLAKQGQDVTQVKIATKLGAVGAVEKDVAYQITAAIPKTDDNLSVNTFGGDDTANVDSTQPDIPSPKPGGHVYLNTGDGDDTITVGDPAWGLDYFFGPVDIDAGSGHNKITFDEHASYVHDQVTLTASQVIRSTQTPTVTATIMITDPGGITRTETRTETGYPFIINYQAGGGDFAPNPAGTPGVIFETSYGATELYIPETGSAAPTKVQAFGGYQNSVDQIRVGYDGQGQTPFPKTAADGTLDLLRSPLTVQGDGLTQLVVDDLGVSGGQAYNLDLQIPPLLGFVQRNGVAPVIYQDLFLTVDCGGGDNQIAAQGIPKNTSATINAGDGNNTITVGDASQRLDEILGPLTINGSTKGTDDLTIHDQGNGQSQIYSLSDTNLTRQGMQPVSISFHDLHSLVFYASAANSDGIQVTGTPANVPVTVYPGPGTGDQLNVVDLDKLKGQLNLIWSQGVKNVLVDDTAAKAAQTYTLGANALNRSGAKPIMFSPFVFLLLDVGLSHADVVRVQAITPATQVQINGGKVTTSVQVADSTKNLDDIAGPLAINGAGGPATTTVTLNDQNEPASRNSYLLNQANFQAGNLPFISFSQLTDLILDAGNQGNTITVHATAAGTHVTVHAGATDTIQVGDGSNTLQGIQGRLDVVGKGPGSRLLLNDSGGVGMSSYVLTATELDHPPSAPIGYQSLGKLILTGSTSGADLYQIKGAPSAASTAVQLVAGGGGNTLDYSSFGSTSSVVVDLQTGFATGLGGGVSGFQKVIGGSGGPAGTYNLLIGNGGNLLVSGMGRRNILVAGASASTLNILGNNMDDLLIAGTTKYDTEAGLASWLQIAAYWAGKDPFATRVSKLAAGTGVPKLDATTVKGNGGGNIFFATGQLVLLYSDGKDVLPFPFFFDSNSKTVTITP